MAEEVHLKFVCRKDDLQAVLRVIEEVHPYEEPAIDVVPQLRWRSLLTPPS
ncbi:MAG: hypothetical protein MJZ38_04825 [archaeon]|nr:hypothetical protein [archaeon]